MEIIATSKNYGKKKGSDHFRDILNPYGEKSNYGKIGRRRRLSKLNVFFFHNSVGDHIPYIMENKKWSKPPTSIYIYKHQITVLMHYLTVSNMQNKNDGLSSVYLFLHSLRSEINYDRGQS